MWPPHLSIPEPLEVPAIRTTRCRKSRTFEPNARGYLRLDGDPSAKGPAGGSDEKNKNAEDIQSLLRALGGKAPTSPNDTEAGANDNSVIFGERTFTDKSGRTLQGRFAGFDDKGQVLIKRVSDGKMFAVPTENLGDADKQLFSKLQQDKGFMAGLKAMPANIHLNSSGIADPDRQMEWETEVVRDIGKLSELEKGRRVLGDVKVQRNEITIKPPRGGDNSAAGGNVYFDPADTKGASAVSGKKRPAFIGLGQELFNAVAGLSRQPSPWAQREEDGLRAGQKLRVEYNKTLDDPDRLNELNGRYPGSGTDPGHPGWGTKKVDERVIGLHGQALQRGRDR